MDSLQRRALVESDEEENHDIIPNIDPWNHQTSPDQNYERQNLIIAPNNDPQNYENASCHNYETITDNNDQNSGNIKRFQIYCSVRVTGFP